MTSRRCGPTRPSRRRPKRTRSRASTSVSTSATTPSKEQTTVGRSASVLPLSYQQRSKDHRPGRPSEAPATRPLMGPASEVVRIEDCHRAWIVGTSLKWIVLALALSPLAAMAPSTAPSGRHGEGHAENHDWYKDLRQPDNGSRCCNGSVDGKRGDCRPTQSYVGADGLSVPGTDANGWSCPRTKSSPCRRL